MKSAPATALFALVAQVFAAPVSDPTHGLLKRQVFEEEPLDWIWKNEDDIDGDRVEVTIGKYRTSFGEHYPSATLDMINEECSASSCQPGVELKKSTYVVGPGGWGPQEIVLNVHASFNTEGVGQKAEMLNYARNALQQLHNEGVATVKKDVPYRSKDCPAWQTRGCLSEFFQSIHIPANQVLT